MAYSTFWEAYLAKHPDSKYTPAGQTWTPQNLQGLANNYSALNPTWTPPTADNAALPNPIKPVVFDPLNDPSYAAAASQYGYTDPKTGKFIPGAQTQKAGAEYGYTDENGVFHPGYQTHRGAQSFGYDQNGNLITSGADLNPYAQAAIMKRNYDNSVRGTTNSYASQGQLYSGALQNQHNAQGTGALDFNYGQSSDQLKRSAQDFYRGNTAAYQGVVDSGTNQLAALLGPAFANFLAGQKGS